MADGRSQDHSHRHGRILCRPSSSGMIRNSEANLSLPPGAGIAPWCLLLRMRHDSLACVLLCPPFAPNAFALAPVTHSGAEIVHHRCDNLDHVSELKVFTTGWYGSKESARSTDRLAVTRSDTPKKSENCPFPEPSASRRRTARRDHPLSQRVQEHADGGSPPQPH